jgi:hypothetical protein
LVTNQEVSREKVRKRALTPYSALIPERLELHQLLRPGSRKRRAYSRLFLARLLLVLDNYRHLLEELFATVGDANEWVAADHDALLGA